jgi:hypothetical protein
VSPGLQGWLAGLLATLVVLRGLLVAFVLAALLSLALRSLLLVVLDGGRGAAVALLRLAAGLAFGTLGVLYLLIAAPSVEWNAASLGFALATATAVLATPFLHRRRPVSSPLPSPWLALLLVLLLVGLPLLGVLSLLPVGFLALHEDRPVMLVDVTGETRVQVVRWAPPDAAPRAEPLTAHRVVFRTPAGEPVAEAWVYGDQVAVKGRVLRLSPLLVAAGVPNLFELQFAHNGYLTADRHAGYPHLAVPLPPTGPLAVHRWWRPLQGRLLQAWERESSDSPGWAVRSLTTESTYYPLVDAEGRPLRRQFQLVLTPGGLSSS